MKTLQKIVSGIALVGALAFGYQANAQIKLSTETQMINNGIGSGIPLHRTVVETKPITVKYDKTTALGNGADPVDVEAIFLNDLFSNDNTNVGAYMINVGNFNRNDEQFFGAWMSKKYDDITATLEAGKGSRATGSPREFAIGYFRSPIFSGDIAYFAQGSTFGKNEIKKYAWGAYHDKHAYVGAGRNVKINLGLLGLKGFDDFGSFTYAIRDEKTGDVRIRSQTAARNVNKSFFNSGLFNVAANYFTLPAFFTRHFSPLSTKGDLTLKLEYKKSGATGAEEREVLLGTNQTPVQISLGINNEKKNNTSVSGLAVELYKDFNIAGIKGDVEVRYNARTKDLQTYVKAAYEF